MFAASTPGLDIITRLNNVLEPDTEEQIAAEATCNKLSWLVQAEHLATWSTRIQHCEKTARQSLKEECTVIQCRKRNACTVLMSTRILAVAVAVTASTGTSGKSFLRSPNCGHNA